MPLGKVQNAIDVPAFQSFLKRRNDFTAEQCVIFLCPFGNQVTAVHFFDIRMLEKQRYKIPRKSAAPNQRYREFPVHIILPRKYSMGFVRLLIL